MKLRRATFLIAAILCFAATVSAQTKPQVETVPDEIVRAEFQPIRGTAPINLAQYKGRVVVLVVWASWCHPCRMAVTAVNELSKQYSARGVEFVGLTTDDPVKEYNDVQQFLERDKIDFQLGWLDDERGKILLARPSVIPQILVIAGDHVIVKRFLGWQEQKTLPAIRKAVDETLAHPPARQ